jgi:hypothetical protein
MILPYLSARSKVTMCSVSPQTHKLMYGTPIDLWDNDLTVDNGNPHRGVHPDRDCYGCWNAYYSTDELRVIAARWHITHVRVKEPVRCEPRFVEWPTSLTTVHYEERITRWDAHQQNAPRSFLIPPHIRSFTLSYEHAKCNLYDHNDDIIVSPCSAVSSYLCVFKLHGCTSCNVDLDALSACVNLERVSLGHDDPAASLWWVWGLPNLEHLALNWAAISAWLRETIPNDTGPIERLSLRWSPGGIHDLTRILLMPQLTRVDLSHLECLHTVQSLGGLRHLQMLTMTHCDRVSTLPAMQHLSTLRLASCKELPEHCSYLNMCRNLRSIEMRGLYALECFNVDLTLVESLTLVDCYSLDSVYIPRSVRRLHIIGCSSLLSVRWSTPPVEADSRPLNIVRDMNGEYTLE